MRLRSLLLVVAAVLVVLLTLLNWEEFTRPVPLNLGYTTVTAPLALLLLGLLALGTLAAVASGLATRARYRRELRERGKVLESQRELADRAEASRFVDLRSQLETHLRETRQREATAAAELDQLAQRTQREVRNQLENLHRSLSTRLGEMEARLESRLDRPAGVHAPVQERVQERVHERVVDERADDRLAARTPEPALSAFREPEHERVVPPSGREGAHPGADRVAPAARPGEPVRPSGPARPR